MAQRVANSLYQFRETFRVLHKEALLWFPGHMGKVEQDGLHSDTEMRDEFKPEFYKSRNSIPLSGRNPNFRYTVSGVKPHILVLNKKDLADLQMKPQMEAILRKQGYHHVFFTNCKDSKCPGVKQIIPTVVKLVSASERYNRSEEKDFSVMVIGVPNIGKSSLINALRSKYLGRGKATAVGAVAGVTRSVQNRIKVSENPLIYLLDTPGILTPNVPDIETGLRLALCACLQDHLVGVEIIADYLLYWLNKNSQFRYVDVMGLEEPTDNIGTVLTKSAVKLGKTQRMRNVDGSGYVCRPDLSAAAHHFIKAFRNGELGRLMLDAQELTSVGS